MSVTLGACHAIRDAAQPGGNRSGLLTHTYNNKPRASYIFMSPQPCKNRTPTPSFSTACHTVKLSKPNTRCALIQLYCDVVHPLSLILLDYAARGQHGRDAAIRSAFPFIGDRKRGQHRLRLRLSTRLPTPVETHFEVAGLHERLCGGRCAAGGSAACCAESVSVLPPREA